MLSTVEDWLLLAKAAIPLKTVKAQIHKPQCIEMLPILTIVYRL